MAESRKIQGLKSGRVLTFADAQEIRSMYCGLGVTFDALASEFGVGRNTILRIVYWETYRTEKQNVGRGRK